MTEKKKRKFNTPGQTERERNMNTVIPTEERLQELGFVTAASEMQKHKEAVSLDLRRKLRTAFEFYRVVEPHHIARFSLILKESTLKRKTRRDRYGRREGTERRWMELTFTTIHNYPAAPPPAVLDKLAEAKERNCFDRFEIAHLTERTEYEMHPIRLPDPILFGRIDQSENRYFIAQWDDDVKIEDILREDEG